MHQNLLTVKQLRSPHSTNADTNQRKEQHLFFSPYELTAPPLRKDPSVNGCIEMHMRLKHRGRNAHCHSVDTPPLHRGRFAHCGQVAAVRTD